MLEWSGGPPEAGCGSDGTQGGCGEVEVCRGGVDINLLTDVEKVPRASVSSQINVGDWATNVEE